MRKKLLSLISVILSVLMCAALFTGCSLVEYDYERDYMQVSAKVNSIQINDAYSSDVFTSAEKKIYKYDVVTALNNLGSDYITYYGVEECIDYVVEQLIIRELILAEADAQVQFGNIVWGQIERNKIAEGVYESVDSQLLTIKNEIRAERGLPSSEESTPEDAEVSTTYPTKDEEAAGVYDDYAKEQLVEEVVTRTIEEGEDRETLTMRVSGYTEERLISILTKLDEEDSTVAYKPHPVSYPGLYGTDAQKSIGAESMRRLLSSLESAIKSDYRLSDADEKKYLDEIAALRTIGNQKGISYVYPELGAFGDDGKMKYEVMYYLVGESYEQSVKVELLEEYITEGVSVSSADVTSYYEQQLAQQKEEYDADVSAFESAVTDNSTTILYYPNGDYYYVKHILVPFSTDQSAALATYKSRDGAIKGDVAEYKQRLGQEVTGYAHVNGEDSGKPVSISEIYSEVENELARFVAIDAATLKLKERAFDDLIYKYNTDSGIFGAELGYAVKGNLGDAEYDSTYMEEFARAADSLYRAYVNGDGKIGDIEMCVTDYGVHIVYLSKVIPSGGLTLSLGDYVSYGQYSTVESVIASSARDNKVNVEFSKWQQNKITSYRNDGETIEIFKDTYQDIIDKNS